jgi:hypothetical protein
MWPSPFVAADGADATVNAIAAAGGQARFIRSDRGW